MYDGGFHGARRHGDAYIRAEAGFVAIFNLRYNTQKVLQNDRKGTLNRSAHFFGLKIQIWKFPTQQHAKNFFINVDVRVTRAASLYRTPRVS